MTFLYIMIVIWVFDLYMMFRNMMIYSFRRRLLDEVKEIARPQVAIEYLDILAAVSYEEMMWKFWRPLKSFYPEEIIKLIE